LRELRALLAPLAIDVDAQGALGIAPAEEPFGTFLENALAKARHAAQRSGLPARFAGEHADDAANNAALQVRLAGIADRRAHYCCVIVALRRFDDPEPLVAEGRWAGRILDGPLGDGGFGYDPVFWLPELGCTVAQIDADRKNRLSHRAQAMRALLGSLPERWDW
jgi:XTP/dITP diphosphohydrolase